MAAPRRDHPDNINPLARRAPSVTRASLVVPVVIVVASCAVVLATMGATDTALAPRALMITGVAALAAAIGCLIPPLADDTKPLLAIVGLAAGALVGLGLGLALPGPAIFYGFVGLLVGVYAANHEVRVAPSRVASRGAAAESAVLGQLQALDGRYALIANRLIPARESHHREREVDLLVARADCVWVVEVKSATDPIVADFDERSWRRVLSDGETAAVKDPVNQVQGQARAVHGYLRSRGVAVDVVAVVVYLAPGVTLDGEAPVAVYTNAGDLIRAIKARGEGRGRGGDPREVLAALSGRDSAPAQDGQ